MMKLINIVNDLRKEDKLNVMYTSGLIPAKTLIYNDYANQYDIELRQGHKKAEAIKNVSAKFKVSERTVYRAVQLMYTDFK